MNCQRCGRENLPEAQFCIRCGVELRNVEAERAADPDARPCYRHPKVMTLVSCGKCDRPLCPDCVTVGAAGVRCRDCARNRVPVRWRGVATDASLGFRRLLGRGPIAFYIVFLLVSMLLSFGRGCFDQPPRRSVPPEIESSGDSSTGGETSE
ncbi:MAG: zinc-ribbon domain-containing protein [Fimbriimonadaceae bacterium]|nr:zinc-ribbon domain-containing protein [Fimbriimonadaceae bacterium]